MDKNGNSGSSGSSGSGGALAAFGDKCKENWDCKDGRCCGIWPFKKCGECCKNKHCLAHQKCKYEHNFS